MQIFDPGNGFHFCGLYQYVNGGESVKYDLKPMSFMIVLRIYRCLHIGKYIKLKFRVMLTNQLAQNYCKYEYVNQPWSC